MAESGTDRVVAVAVGPDGSFRAYPMLPGFWDPSYLAAGPDGRIWVSGHGSNWVGALNPASGAVTPYPLHPPDSPDLPVARPSGIAMDRNGHVWVAEHEGNRIARIVPGEDRVVEYVLPHPDSLLR